MYQLYFGQGACSLAVHTFLHQLQLPFDHHKLDMSKGEHKNPEYLKLNPRGQVPTLILDDGTVMTEVTAILTYLADAYPSVMFPAPGKSSQRATALRWLSFTNDTLHGLYGAYFGLKGTGSDSGKFYEKTCTSIAECWQQIEHQLSNNEFITGNQLGVVDILLTVIAGWGKPETVTFGPNTQRVINAVKELPAFQEAQKHEAAPAKAA